MAEYPKKGKNKKYLVKELEYQYHGEQMRELGLCGLEKMISVILLRPQGTLNHSTTVQREIEARWEIASSLRKQ